MVGGIQRRPFSTRCKEINYLKSSFTSEFALFRVWLNYSALQCMGSAFSYKRFQPHVPWQSQRLNEIWRRLKEWSKTTLRTIVHFTQGSQFGNSTKPPLFLFCYLLHLAKCQLTPWFKNYRVFSGQRWSPRFLSKMALCCFNSFDSPQVQTPPFNVGLLKGFRRTLGGFIFFLWCFPSHREECLWPLLASVTAVLRNAWPGQSFPCSGAL